jgi:cell wall assembly regulator SMI1
MTSTDFFRNIEDFGHNLADLGFSDGATKEQIIELENELNRTLPDEFKQFIKRVNGQVSDKFYFLPDQALLFSTQDIISEYKSLLEYVDDTIEFYDEYQFKDKVRCPVWSESRIPIAGNDGYYLFLDYDPGPNGNIGQVIFLTNECDYVVLSPTFKDFIDNYNKLILNQTLKIKEIVEGQYSHFRLTNDKDFLDGNDFVELFGQ